MEENKKFEFYGGNFGPWIPVIFMIVSMVLCTITGNGGLQRFCILTFAALAIGFFLAKDKKNFGQLSLKGLRNPMLGTVIMAYLLAGILSQLLRQSGLIDSLILLVSELNLNVGFLPLVGFITCMLISTSCGTSTGSVAAVAPVLIPLANSLGVDIGLMSGTIISGAFDALGVELLKLCKSPRSAELVCYIIASVGSAASGRKFETEETAEEEMVNA